MTELDNILNDIENGRKRYKRYEFLEQQANDCKENNRRDRTNEAISIILQSESGSNRSPERMDGKTKITQDEQNERQERVIEKWAKNQGIWIDDAELVFNKKYGNPIGRGQESVVYDNKESVVKLKNTLQYYDLLESLVGIKLHNELFPETFIKLIGFGNDSEGFVMIIQQDFVVSKKFLTENEIYEFVKSLDLGFQDEDNQSFPFRFENDSLYLKDIHEGNVVRTAQGFTTVIDAIIKPKNITEYLKQCF